MTHETKQHIRAFMEIRFVAVAIVSEYHVEYKLFEIAGTDESGNLLYNSKNWSSSLDVVDDRGASEPYAHGYVKWDGCSNWYFDEQDRILLHGCCRADLTRIGEALASCWDWTKDLLPTWDGDS